MMGENPAHSMRVEKNNLEIIVIDRNIRTRDTCLTLNFILKVWKQK